MHLRGDLRRGSRRGPAPPAPRTPPGRAPCGDPSRRVEAPPRHLGEDGRMTDHSALPYVDEHATTIVAEPGRRPGRPARHPGPDVLAARRGGVRPGRPVHPARRLGSASPGCGLDGARFRGLRCGGRRDRARGAAPLLDVRLGLPARPGVAGADSPPSRDPGLVPGPDRWRVPGAGDRHARPRSRHAAPAGGRTAPGRGAAPRRDTTAGPDSVRTGRSGATPTGLEPAASAVTGRRANQLRYGARCALSCVSRAVEL